MTGTYLQCYVDNHHKHQFPTHTKWRGCDSCKAHIHLNIREYLFPTWCSQSSISVVIKQKIHFLAQFAFREIPYIPTNTKRKMIPKQFTSDGHCYATTIQCVDHFMKVLLRQVKNSVTQRKSLPHTRDPGSQAHRYTVLWLELFHQYHLHLPFHKILLQT